MRLMNAAISAFSSLCRAEHTIFCGTRNTRSAMFDQINTFRNNPVKRIRWVCVIRSMSIMWHKFSRDEMHNEWLRFGAEDAVRPGIVWQRPRNQCSEKISQFFHNNEENCRQNGLICMSNGFMCSASPEQSKFSMPPHIQRTPNWSAWIWYIDKICEAMLRQPCY